MEIFNIRLEFDKSLVIEKIINAIKFSRANFVCVVDGNVLSKTNKDKKYNDIVNNSLVNICDGSFIALLANIIYKKKFRTFTGAELFSEFVYKNKYRMYFLGNTSKVLNGLRQHLLKQQCDIGKMYFESLPFLDVNEFDYHSIANNINLVNPDIIWVSLGAPKQEEFMFRLRPFLKRGIMIGVGAVFNFNSDYSDEKRAPGIIQKLRLEWLYRIISNPYKQVPKAVAFLNSIPKIYYSEKRKQNSIQE